jgi:sarcosine oxidase subunit alpha
VEPRPHDLPGAPAGDPVSIEFEGQTLSAKLGEPLIATLIAHGIDIASRSVKYHRPRGAFCLAGICGQCWMRIDGIPNRAACTTASRPGLRATRENAFPSADLDLLRAADFVFPGGLDHHTLGTTPSRAVNTLIGGTARQLAGLGAVSDQIPAPAKPMRSTSADLVVIGGGPAGLAAARAAAKSGLGVLLVEKRREVGGQLNSGLFDDRADLRDLPAAIATELEQRGAVIWTRAHAIGIYRDPSGALEVLIRRDVGGPEEHLARARPDRLILAPGGYEQAALFGDHDLPGHYAARGFARMALRRGVMPGEKPLIIDGGGETGWRLQRRLEAIGRPATRICFAQADAAPAHAGEVILGSGVARAKGRGGIRSVEIAPLADPRRGRSLKVDLVISALPPAPAHELAHQAGCTLEHRPERGGFVPVVTAALQTSQAGVYAAGDLIGAPSVADALAQGERAGLAAAGGQR